MGPLIEDKPASRISTTSIVSCLGKMKEIPVLASQHTNWAHVREQIS